MASIYLILKDSSQLQSDLAQRTGITIDVYDEDVTRMIITLDQEIIAMVQLVF